MSISHFVSSSSIWQQHGGTIAVFTFWAIVGVILMTVGYATKATYRGARNRLLALFFHRSQPSRVLHSNKRSLRSLKAAPIAGYVIGSVALSGYQVSLSSSTDDFFARNMQNASAHGLHRLVGNDVIAAATS